MMNKEQKQLDTHYQENNWSYWTPHEILARLTEEVGELARLINHEYGPKPKKSSEAEQELEEEIGDVLYAVACLANTLDINLDDAFQKSMDKSHERDKNRF